MDASPGHGRPRAVHAPDVRPVVGAASRQVAAARGDRHLDEEVGDARPGVHGPGLRAAGTQGVVAEHKAQYVAEISRRINILSRKK